MKRREIGRMVLGAGLMAAGMARAGHDDDPRHNRRDRTDLPEAGTLRLKLADGTHSWIDWLILTTPAGNYARRLTGSETMFPVDRLAVPAPLDRFFWPTPAQVLATGHRIGPVLLSGRTLVVAASEAVATDRRVAVMHRKQGWDLAPLRSAEVSGVSPMRSLAGLEGIGSAYVTERQIALLIPPYRLSRLQPPVTGVSLTAEVR